MPFSSESNREEIKSDKKSLRLLIYTLCNRDVNKFKEITRSIGCDNALTRMY